jgi:outer membrane biosynthesis protein TonB
MKGRYASAFDAPEKMLLTALVISLLAHLLTFGVWELGKTLGWWRQIGLPHWMLLVKKSNATPLLPLKKNPPLTQPQTAPLVFVDVDPSRFTEAPKNPKFYSSANSLASNPTKKTESDMPQIDGHQTVVVKTTVPATPKSQPLQPSPPTPQKTETPENKTDSTKELKNESKSESKAQNPSDPQPISRPAPAPGDLAMLKPQQNRLFDTNAQFTPQNPAPAETPPSHRPRSLAEAHEQQHGLQGEPMRQEGGVSRIEMAPSSLDAVKTAWGDYDRRLIDAVETRWYALLREHPPTLQGKVRLEFRLHADGRVTDLKMLGNEVNELQETLCERAIEDPAPFEKWPNQMRLEITDPRDVAFTFYYLNY